MTRRVCTHPPLRTLLPHTAIAVSWPLSQSVSAAPIVSADSGLRGVPDGPLALHSRHSHRRAPVTVRVARW